MSSPEALVLIDVQNDFCPGGSLAVPDGDAVVPAINRISGSFPLVVATRDWHPAGHISFAGSHAEKKPQDIVTVSYGEQVLWPDHCVQQTKGADFHPDLDLRPLSLILHKGTKENLDSYSAFFENDKQTPTGLDFYLRGLGVEHLVFCGLATDYCVYFSVVDALNLGYRVTLVSDAVRGVDFPPGNVKRTLADMEHRGALIRSTHDFI